MLSERELTAQLKSFFPTHRDVIIGIGDDAAVVRQRHERCVLCCDPVVGSVHFSEDTEPALIGRKAVNRNLSDLAAMGAVADWLLVSLVVPRNVSDEYLRSILLGVRKAASAARCHVVGGDIATSDGPLVVTVSAFGHLLGPALKRSGASVGDTLHVTGPLGGSLAGHHLRFRPPLLEGLWLARQSCVTAAMDVSDGLLLDLETMLLASGGLGAELNAKAIPIRRVAYTRAKGDARVALRSALSDGEDHVLLWSQRSKGALRRGGPLTDRARKPIGKILPDPGLWLVDGDERTRLQPVGFQHHWRNNDKVAT